MEHRLKTEAQQLLEAAFAGKLDMDADAPQLPEVNAADGEAQGQKTAETATPNETQATTTPAQDDEPAGAPIAAKSGGYTIPYEKLTQARLERDNFRAENEQLKAQLAQLNQSQAQNLVAAQQDAQARADAGQAPTDADKNLAIAQAAAADGVDLSLFGDFTEEGIAKGVAALVDAQVNAKVEAAVQARLQQALAPLQQREARTAADEHSNSIYQAHPDADSIVDSKEFADWLAAQPGFSRNAIEAVLDPKTGGTAGDRSVFGIQGCDGQSGAPSGRRQRRSEASHGEGCKPAACQLVGTARGACHFWLGYGAHGCAC
jgi:Meckel syndrome type 1 protein